MCDSNCGCGARTRRGRKWNQTVINYGQDTYGIILRKWCNAFAVHNDGNVTIRFNREMIPAGGTKSVSMHEDDEYIGTIDLQFMTTGVPGEIPSAWITQLFYVEPPNP